MRDDQAKLIKGIDDLEPGGFGEAIIGGAFGLSRLLEQVMWAVADTRDLRKQIDTLDDRLDSLDKKLDTFIKVLSSIPDRD